MFYGPVLNFMVRGFPKKAFLKLSYLAAGSDSAPSFTFFLRPFLSYGGGCNRSLRSRQRTSRMRLLREFNSMQFNVLRQASARVTKARSLNTMKAAIWEGANKGVKMAELMMPAPKLGEVLIRVAACGVCHTDLHVMKGEVPFPGPAVLGHEISGHIVQVGDGVSGLESGQRVVSSFIMPCGTCFYCARGEDDTCEKFFAMNRLKGTLYDGHTRLFTPTQSPVWMYSMGGLAQYCVVPATDVFALPDKLQLTDSAILGCAIFTAYGAVKNAADLRAGESVCVIGAGGVGMATIQMCRAFGAGPIIAVDVDDGKLKQAKQLGADVVINAAKTNVTDAITASTDGRKVDVCFEALGSKQTFEQCIMAVRDGGKAVMVGIAAVGVKAEVPITHIVRRRISVIGSYGGRTRQDMPAILKLAERGVLTLPNLISKRFSLNDAGRAYEELAAGKILGRAIIDMSLP